MFSFPLIAAVAVCIGSCAFYQLHEHPKTELVNHSTKPIIIHYKDIQISLNHVQMTKLDFAGTVADASRSSDKPDNDIHSKEQSLEAHVYLDSLHYVKITNGMTLQIPFCDVKILKLYDVNTQRMVLTYGGMTVAATLTVLFFATKQSCPFIYAFNGNSFGFAGEIFSGAVYPQLERDDYLSLPSLQSISGKYQLRITNEVKEAQHVNLMELMAVDHPSGTRVLVEGDGVVHTLADLQSPIRCIAPDGSDVRSLTEAADSLSYTSNGVSPSFR